MPLLLLVAGSLAALVLPRAGAADGSQQRFQQLATALPAPIAAPATGESTIVTCATLRGALARLHAGSTILVRAGTCNGEYKIVAKDLAHPAEIRAYPGERVFFAGALSKGAPGIFVSDSTNVVIGRGFDVRNPDGSCVTISGSTNVRVVGMRVHDCGGQGILVYTEAATAQNANVQIDGNEIYHAGSADGARFPAGDGDGYWRFGTHAIYFGGGDGVTVGGGVWNNYIHDQPAGYGIQVGGAAQETFITANTIRRITRDPRKESPPQVADRAGACIQLYSSDAGTRGVRVVDNVCTEPATRAIYGSCTCTEVMGDVWDNVVWQAGITPAISAAYGDTLLFKVGRNWQLDPQLRNDGRPRPGSPLAGLADPRYLPQFDFVGRPRTSLSPGAFEPALH